MKKSQAKSRLKSLTVWMNGERVATWSINQGKDTLTYDDHWLRSPHARPLSLTMPFTPENKPYTGEVVAFWFDNLLPDSPQLRQRIARRFKTLGQTPFDLLSEVGRDSVGAVQLLPTHQQPSQIKTIQAKAITETEIADYLSSYTSSSSLQNQSFNLDEFRISLAGAQEKSALLKQDGIWKLPLGSTPTTHILKLPLGLIGNLQMDMTDSVENEWLCLQLLGAYGLPVAVGTIERFNHLKALVLERFDRVLSADSSWLIRLPQEDMCQAMAYPNYLKYEADGGPGMDKILKLLASSTNANQDKFNFIKAQFLFCLLCASDGHAKNFSVFIKPGGLFEMTPFYDVLSLYPVMGSAPDQIAWRKVKMAMAVRGKNPHWKMSEIQPRHWYDLALRHGIAVTGQDSPFQQVIDQTPRVIEKIKDLLPADFPVKVSQSIFDGLSNAVKRFELK